MKTLRPILLGTLAILGTAGCMNDAPDDVMELTTRALSEEDCLAGTEGGKVEVCHETGSDTNTFVLITVSTKACEAAHAAHAGDKLPVNGSCDAPAVGQDCAALQAGTGGTGIGSWNQPADGSNCDLTGVDLSGSNHGHTNLNYANLTGANLTNAMLARADLNHANLTDANLTGANFQDCNMQSANLTGANPQDAASLLFVDMSGVTCPDGWVHDYSITQYWPGVCQGHF